MGIFRSIWIWLMMAALLLLGAVVLLMDGGEGVEISGVGEAEVARPRLTAITKSLGSAVVKRSVKIDLGDRGEVVSDPYEEWATVKILQQFGVPAGAFEGATMEDVVAYLGEVYSENGGRGVEFRVEGGSGFPITCTYGNVSAQALMDLVAGLGGYVLTVGDGEVVFRRKPEPLAGQRTTLTFKAGELDKVLGDVLVNVLDGGDVSGDLLAAALCQWGIVSDVPMAVNRFEQLDVAQVELEARDAGRLQAIRDYQQMASSSLGQLLMTSKVIHSEYESISTETTNLTDREFQVAMRELSQRKGTSLRSTPSLVMGAGQTGRIEIVREHIFPTEWDANGEPSAYDVENVGLMIDFSAAVLGLDRVGMTGVTTHTLVRDQTLHELTTETRAPSHRPPLGAGKDDFRSLRTEFEGQLFDGNTAGFLAGQEGKEGLLQFVTVRRIDPSGTPLISNQNE